MASIAKTIADAILKVSTEETYANMEFATREEARESFTAALLYELGLGPKPAAAHAPVAVPTEAAEPAKKAPKKRAAKKSTEAVVAEAAVAILEQVKEAVPEVEALAEQMGQLALEEQPKPKKARKTKTESEPASSESESEKKDGEPAVATKKKPGPKPKKAVNPHPGMGAGVPPPEPVAEKKKPGPKPKAKPEGPVNVEKLTPTLKKHLKSASEELKVAIDEKEFLAYANAMSAEEWGAKSVAEHIRAFAGPKPEQTTFLAVEFNGKEYLIDPATRFIYEPTEGKVTTKLGEVGKEPFEEMDMPEEDA